MTDAGGTHALNARRRHSASLTACPSKSLLKYAYTSPPVSSTAESRFAHGASPLAR